MSTSALRDVVARLATEPALAAELDDDPDAFGRQHRLTVDEVATVVVRGGDCPRLYTDWVFPFTAPPALVEQVENLVG